MSEDGGQVILEELSDSWFDGHATLYIPDFVLRVDADGVHLAHVDDHTTLDRRCTTEVMPTACDRNRQSLRPSKLERDGSV